jgi:DNA polymerase I
MIDLSVYRETWLVDFEFSTTPGEHPDVRCMVARELKTDRTLRIWEDDLKIMACPPFSVGPDVLYVAYYASAEMGCHISLGWPLPENLLDLYTEFRNLRNGVYVPSGYSLLGALTFYGLDSLEAVGKKEMRNLAIRGGPYKEEEKIALLNYCESDVAALSRLMPKMLPQIHLERALLRGRYMKATARIESTGVPIDVEMLSKFREGWEGIQDELIRRININYGVYEGRTFKRDRFKGYLVREGIPWPTLPSGEIDLTDNTFKEMARSYMKIAPLRELRQSLSQMRLTELPVGRDGRNRCLLSPFRSKTGRNQPSNSRFIFGPSAWLRGLIKPEPGTGVSYIDWSQQEFGIAAALSKDPKMMEAYLSGDPYLAFAKQAGAVPPDGTKKTHPIQRSLFKACVLAVQYGMGAKSLTARIGEPEIVARDLLNLHRKTYKVFWAWSDGCLDYAMLNSKLWTVFGWTLHIGENPNPRSIRNFLMQANGAEMLRLACCLVTEAGIKICAPVHDAILIEAPLDELDVVVTKTQDLMKEASAVILDGFKLRSDAETYRYPDRYVDERGVEMWELVNQILDEKGF